MRTGNGLTHRRTATTLRCMKTSIVRAALTTAVITLALVAFDKVPAADRKDMLAELRSGLFPPRVVETLTRRYGGQ